MRLRTIIAATLFSLTLAGSAIAQQQDTQVIAGFEDEESIAGKKTSHTAIVTLVDDLPEDVGKFAVKTVVDPNAGATKFFSTGFTIPSTNLSRAAELRFWIKTDFESRFNLQLSSGAGKTSVFPFTTVGSNGAWKLISAPASELRKSSFAKEPADLSGIHYVQITAFGSPPYDGKTVVIDEVVGVVGQDAGSPSGQLIVRPARDHVATAGSEAARAEDSQAG